MAPSSAIVMNWLCPQCQRPVSLAYPRCPICGSEPTEVSAPPAEREKGERVIVSGWADLKRGFRFGLGFLLAMGIVLFALAAILFLLGHGDWLNRVLVWWGRVGA